MSCPAANCDPFVGIIALTKSFIILRFLDSCVSRERAASDVRF